ncbi:hypothetical protein NX059_011518 [Plenodomus lindquistii]|nr:hypothetical protein NX059_011518 [Plenodomus lindquistii]
MSKSMKTVTSKNRGAKRADTSAEVSGPRKRQRPNRDLVIKSAPQPLGEDNKPDPNYQRKGVFRFLELPGGTSLSSLLIPKTPY